MDYTQLPRTIKLPYWTTPDKDQVVCQFHYEGGPISTVSVSDTEEGNPDWHEIMEKFTIEEIDKNTEELLAIEREKERKQKELAEDQAAQMKSDVLYEAKLEAFEIPEIKNSKNRKLKSLIRKSKTLGEIQAYTAVLVMKEMEKSDGK